MGLFLISKAAAGTFSFQLTLFHVDSGLNHSVMQSVPLALLFHFEGQFPKSGFYCVRSQLQNPSPDACALGFSCFCHSPML